MDRVETLTAKLHDQSEELKIAKETIKTLRSQQKNARTGIAAAMKDDTAAASGVGHAQSTIQQLKEELQLRKQQVLRSRKQLSKADAELDLITPESEQKRTSLQQNLELFGEK